MSGQVSLLITNNNNKRINNLTPRTLGLVLGLGPLLLSIFGHENISKSSKARNPLFLSFLNFYHQNCPLDKMIGVKSKDIFMCIMGCLLSIVRTLISYIRHLLMMSKSNPCCYHLCHIWSSSSYPAMINKTLI